MLTANADDHELFKHFHKPGDEKRMVVILHEHQYDEWLTAPPAKSMEFMRQFPAHLLISEPDPNRGRKKTKPASQAYSSSPEQSLDFDND